MILPDITTRLDDLVTEWRQRQTVINCDQLISLPKAEKLRLTVAERTLDTIQRVLLDVGI
jgi:hypothetical protein